MNVVDEVLAFSRDYVNGNQTSERNHKIAAAYKQLTGEQLRVGCRTCYVEAIFKIKKIMEKGQSKYRLKPGALLTAFGDASKVMTNNNITDELAEWHLKNNPGVAKYFSVIPVAPEPEKELLIVKVRQTFEESKQKAAEVLKPETINIVQKKVRGKRRK